MCVCAPLYAQLASNHYPTVRGLEELTNRAAQLYSVLRRYVIVTFVAIIELIKLKESRNDRIIEIIQALKNEEQEKGAKFAGIYLTLGKYDAVAVIESQLSEDIFNGPFARQHIASVDSLVWSATLRHE